MHVPLCAQTWVRETENVCVRACTRACMHVSACMYAYALTCMSVAHACTHAHARACKCDFVRALGNEALRAWAYPFCVNMRHTFVCACVSSWRLHSDIFSPVAAQSGVSCCFVLFALWACLFVCVCVCVSSWRQYSEVFSPHVAAQSGVSCCFMLFELLCTHFGMVKFVDKQGAVKTSIIIHTNGLTQSQLSKPVLM